MVERDAEARNLEDLREFYDALTGRVWEEPDLDGAVIAAMWGEFGARCRASAALLAGAAIDWSTVIATVTSKQRDYGKENILRFGQIGLTVRVHDKLARLEHLTATGRPPGNESLADTVLDLVGYSVLGILLARDWFELELR